MLHKIFSSGLFVALFAMLIGVSSLNAQDIGKTKMMDKKDKMEHEMHSVDLIKTDMNNDGKVFACHMGCEVKDEAGRCSKCEMKLKEMSVDDAANLLKEKGMAVMDHSKMEMKEDCTDKCESTCTDKKEDARSDAKAFNKVCPVSGKAVSDNSPTVEFDGKTYGFCCPGCVEKFNSDPAKYSKNLSEDGSQFEAGDM